LENSKLYSCDKTKVNETNSKGIDPLYSTFFRVYSRLDGLHGVVAVPTLPQTLFASLPRVYEFESAVLLTSLRPYGTPVDHFALSFAKRSFSFSSSACGIVDKALALSEKLSRSFLLK
jgi:hypothetical protein